MNKGKIIKYATVMQTKVDLLKLLNSIKKMELEDCGLSKEFHPITMKQLNYYCNPKHTFHRYKQFVIPKKTGGKRIITAPQKGSFRLMLSALNQLFKFLYTPSDYAMGFTEGRSIVTNADVHKGQNYVFNIDLKDFFPSIRQPRVWKRIQLPPFNFTKEVANVIAGLCSMQIKKEDGTLDYVLPQGAPTSPIITNMICDKLDRRLAGLAKRFGLHYTRYADDITFSSLHYVYSLNGEFRKELERIIADQGFTINDKKTRLQTRAMRQEVTGITVSDKLNVTQKYVREIRNLLYIWEKYGYVDAVSKFLPKYKVEKQRKGNPDLINVLSGKLLYLKMVKGEEDSVYIRLSQKFNKLVADFMDVTRRSATGLMYIKTYTIDEFEKRFNTKIKIETFETNTKEKEINVKTENEGQAKKKTHRYASFILSNEEGEDIKQNISIRRNVKWNDDPKTKRKLAVSQCQKGNAKPFWLLHYRAEKQAVEQKDVSIEDLNNVLDNLLSTLDDGTTIS
ncbi:MAG: RNA-directed DNA polymerase [Bacteroidaceae bacterium]|nr:RNA-directed DNA polymerase [Bacteroidaceae bacterium]